MKTESRNALVVALFVAGGLVAWFIGESMNSTAKSNLAAAEKIKTPYTAVVMTDVQISNGLLGYYPIYVCQGSGLGDGECRIRTIHANSANVPLEKGDEVEVSTAEDPTAGSGWLSVERVVKIK